jgi:type IV pilus assembly protein PilV
MTHAFSGEKKPSNQNNNNMEVTHSGAISQLGFSILEVLIGTFVIAFGFLGYAYLASVSIKSTHDNFLRTQAIVYANDILERMRANIVVATDSPEGYLIGANDQGATNIDCEIDDCSPEMIRDWDLSQWKQALADDLLDAVGEITFDTFGVNPQRKYNVRIEFSKRTQFEKGGNPERGSVSVSTVL